MFPGVKLWWSGNNESNPVCEEPEEKQVISDTGSISEKQNQNSDEELKKAYNVAKEWGSYIFNVSKKATKAAAEHVTTTAKQLKEQVDEKNVLDKTPVISDFNRHQSEFIEQQRKVKQKAEASVPPWVGYSAEEETALRAQILNLSQEERNFTRNPPAGTKFDFDFDANFPVAMSLLQEDPELAQMRFKLVPKKLKEEVFWRNYFYRVCLIKQSAQLTSLQFNVQKETDSNQRSDTSTESYDRLSDFDDAKGQTGTEATVTVNRDRGLSESDQLHDQDFVSDVDGPQTGHNLSREEREALGMSSDVPDNSKSDKEPLDEWEQELQRELNEYELVTGGDSTDIKNPDEQDEELEREIMEQLEKE